MRMPFGEGKMALERLIHRGTTSRGHDRYQLAKFMQFVNANVDPRDRARTRKASTGRANPTGLHRFRRSSTDGATAAQQW
jgi:hypothetical protein